MNQLIAKIRDRSRTSIKYRKVLSGEEVFSIPESLDDIVDYSPFTLLEDGQWYVIADFSIKEYCLDILKDDDFNSVDYELLETSAFEKLDYLLSYQEGVYFFQNIPKSQLVRKKILSIGERFTFDKNNASIPIKEIADAIYVKETNKLYFRKLASISSIFSGIDQLYREATDEETTQFLNEDFIALVDGFSPNDVKKENRKKIALALDTLNGFTEDDRQTVFTYIKEYIPNLSASENTFSIGNENDLRMLLFGIGQQFYTTVVGQEKRIANSVRKFAGQT